MKATIKDKGQRVPVRILAYLPGLPHEPLNVLVVYMLDGSFLVKVSKINDLEIVGAS